jgi:ribonucleoside-diphosphate reductase beta chain
MTYATRNHSFYLDAGKAELALAGKRMIGGVDAGCFDLFPLRYEWACEKYGIMMSNHWEPEDIPMQKDVEQWQSEAVTANERWIIMMGIGYFSAAEGIVGDNIQHVVRDLVTAAELKLVLGRHAHEENIHADSLLYMISALGINPHECEAMFEQIPTIVRKNEFVTRHSKGLRRGLDLTRLENKQLLAKNLFVFGQCMEGTQFYGLFAMILSLKRQGKFMGIGAMFEYTLRDETNHIEVFRQLFLELLTENPEIATPAFREELVSTMQEAVSLEKEFIRDCLPVSTVGLTVAEAERYIDYVADCRLMGCGLPQLHSGLKDPLPWLDESIRLLKEKNFFEGPVTAYQKIASFMSEVFKTTDGTDRTLTAGRGDLRAGLWADSGAVVRPEKTKAVGEAAREAATPLPAPTSGVATYTIGSRKFYLDQRKAKAAYALKRVINGRETLTFNLLPLRYEWAYDLYKKMKAMNWGPMSSDIQMHRDEALWQAGALTEAEQQLVRLCLGWLTHSPRLPGAGLQHVIRSLVTSPELKLVLGRETQDINLRVEVPLFAASMLKQDIHACEELFAEATSLERRKDLVRKYSAGFSTEMDLTSVEGRRVFARMVFLAGPCLKGMVFFPLHAAMMQLAPKCPGLVQMLSHILRDEASYGEVLMRLFIELLQENPELKEPDFLAELGALMAEVVALEKAFIQEHLGDADGRDLAGLMDYLANCRLCACRLPLLNAAGITPSQTLKMQLHIFEAPRGTGGPITEPVNDDDL